MSRKRTRDDGYRHYHPDGDESREVWRPISEFPPTKRRKRVRRSIVRGNPTARQVVKLAFWGTLFGATVYALFSIPNRFVSA